MKSRTSYLRWPLAMIVALCVAACASMGRPEGGPRDETPPVFVKSRPNPSALNVTSDRIVIEFDENVQVDDPLNKIVVSPAQQTPARVTSVGRKVTVQLMDSLKPNTTYTIDFTDAIKDLNEGNQLEGFSFDFSTGPILDSLCISGMVFAAENLEPAQSMLVGVHSNLSDTALMKLPFDRITRTNQFGQFTIRNLKPGTYNMFAINDVNRDNKWDRSEDVAFYPVTVSPTSSRTSVSDTLKAEDGVTDSIVVREVTVFEPNDILLTWFNENYKSQYMMKNERRDRNKIYFEFATRSDSLPSLRFVGGPHDGEDFTTYTSLQASAGRDTLTYWIKDSTIVALDSIYLATTYLRTDTLDQLSWTTDTLNFSLRAQKKQKPKTQEKSDTTTEAPKVELLRLKSNITGTAEIYSPFVIETNEPIAEFDPAAIKFEIMLDKDTVWTSVEAPEFAQPRPYDPLTLRSDYKWTPGAKYRLTVDSLGITGIYGHSNGPEKYEFSVRKREEYGNMTFNITGLNGAPAIVQLMDKHDAPAYTVAVTNSTARFTNVLPATYYPRLILDRNDNGKWDTGSVADSLQPEDVFYFPKKIALKKNWDITQNWDIYETAVDLQKPNDIKKNKPKAKKGQQQPEDEEDDQYYDEFGNPAVDPDDPFGKRKGSNYNRNNRSNATGRNGLGTRGYSM